MRAAEQRPFRGAVAGTVGIGSLLASPQGVPQHALASPIDEPDVNDTDVPDVRHTVFGDLKEVLGTELPQYRELLLQLTLRDIRIRYKQAIMGFAWAVLTPALVVAAGALVRFAMAYVGGSELALREIASMAAKALPWSFFVGAIAFSTTSLTANAALVTKVFFPREVLPLAAVLAQAFDSMIGAACVLLALPLLGVAFSPALLWVALLAPLLFAFTAGIALLVSSANLFFRDVKYLVQVLTTFGIFFTPVFFEPEMFGPVGAQVMMLNPLAPMLEGIRLAVVEGHNLAIPMATAAGVQVWSPWLLAYSALWAAAALTAGIVLFHRLEFVFAEYA